MAASKAGGQKKKAAPKKKTVKKKANGRPSAYKPEYAKQAEYLCENFGATDAQLGEFFKVTEQTINNWKKDFPKFFESLKGSKSNFDHRIKIALAERAMGYSHIDTKFATHEGMITDEKEYTKHYPPDTTACIYWLNNRDPENFRARPEEKPTEANDHIVDKLLKKLANELPD